MGEHATERVIAVRIRVPMRQEDYRSIPGSGFEEGAPRYVVWTWPRTWDRASERQVAALSIELDRLVNRKVMIGVINGRANILQKRRKVVPGRIGYEDVEPDLGPRRGLDRITFCREKSLSRFHVSPPGNHVQLAYGHADIGKLIRIALFTAQIGARPIAI